MAKTVLALSVVLACGCGASPLVNARHELGPKAKCYASEQRTASRMTSFGAWSVVAGVSELLAGSIMTGLAAKDSSNRHSESSPILPIAVGALAVGAIETLVGGMLLSYGGDHFDNALQCEDPPQ
jgi:hypothetical protein